MQPAWPRAPPRRDGRIGTELVQLCSSSGGGGGDRVRACTAGAILLGVMQEQRWQQQQPGSPAEETEPGSPAEAEPELCADQDSYFRTQALISEMCMTDIATSTGAMVATIDKFPGLTLQNFNAENVQVAVSIIMDPGLWFQNSGQARQILSERGRKQLAELHEESLLRLRIAAGGPTAGCNYRTHAGRTDPKCSIIGELQRPSIQPGLDMDMAEGDSAIQGGHAGGEATPACAPSADEVWGAASLLRRLAVFQDTPSERVLEVRVNDASAATSMRTSDVSGGLPLDIPSTLALAHEWVSSHPSPLVRTWEIDDDFEPPEGCGTKDPEAVRRGMTTAPLLRVKKTDLLQVGGSLAEPGANARATRQPPTIVLSPEDFREMLSA